MAITLPQQAYKKDATQQSIETRMKNILETLKKLKAEDGCTITFFFEETMKASISFWADNKEYHSLIPASEPLIQALIDFQFGNISTLEQYVNTGNFDETLTEDNTEELCELLMGTELRRSVSKQGANTYKGIPVRNAKFFIDKRTIEIRLIENMGVNELLKTFYVGGANVIEL